MQYTESSGGRLISILYAVDMVRLLIWFTSSQHRDMLL